MLAPDAFSPVPNAWGKQGWTTVTLAKIKVAELNVDRKIHLVCPSKRSLSHAAKAFLELVRGA